jgi:hypothetical protein
MAALADIFAAVRLQLDGSGFEAQAKALATKSGKNAGQQMSANLSASFKKAAGAAMGAGVGLAFAAGASGAQELTAATAEFTAQAGASDAQAKEFTATLAALNKVNVQGIPEIGAMLTELKVNFGLTGDAAKEAGSRFLDFARIAGGTAAESVGRFDELVDAGVITVDQMSGMMDKLVASHSKFGVNINDTISALISFAPAMRAANISTDDAIGLMNMFSESGLDAEATTKAFNLALTKVKSPEELQALIADISATEDPLKRAQKSVDLFGAKAGVKLANALKPGSGGIAAWSVNAAEAAGAVQKAGDALDADPFIKAKLWLKQLSGSLAETGTNAGDLLMVFALLGPGLTKGLLAGMGGLGGLLIPKIAEQLGLTLPAWMAGGRAAGLAYAAAAAAAIAGLGLAAAAGDAIRKETAGAFGIKDAPPGFFDVLFDGDALAKHVQGMAQPTGGVYTGPRGRASGGPVSAGQIYRVNESAVEYFRPSVDGAVLTPLQAGRAGGGGGGMTVNVGGVTLNGIGSDVSARSAREWSQRVADSIASTLREQQARSGW